MKSIKFETLFLDIYEAQTVDKTSSVNILYVLDGDAFSLSFSEAINLQCRNSPKTGVEPTMVVGISYHEETFFKERRFLDFTPKELYPRLEGDKRKDFPTGGKINDFLQQLNRVHDFISQKYTINKQKVGLFGHSLGGLCVLESYLQESLPFVTHFIAVSPSLWWDREAFFERLSKKEKINKKNIAIAVGENEDDMVVLAKKAFINLQTFDLVDNIVFYEAEEENHMSVCFQTMSRHLRWFCLK